MHYSLKEHNLFENATTTVTSGWVDVSAGSYFTLFVFASLVTSGASFSLQAKDSYGNSHAIHTFTLTANGSYTPPVFYGAFSQIRLAITSRTDGTYDAVINSKELR